MKREWKPGDVAFGRYPIWGAGGRETTYEEMRLVRYDCGWARADNPDDTVGDGNPTQHIDPRPLVVIDAEDHEQVERFAKALMMHTESAQMALRSLVTPPKPVEPTGRYAVVVDAHGDEWLRAAVGHAPWLQSGYFTVANWTNYDEITAVKVLSEGVPS